MAFYNSFECLSPLVRYNHPTAPILPYAENFSRPQSFGEDSNGNIYVYNRTPKIRKSYTLKWVNVTYAKVTNFTNFFKTSGVGMFGKFTWYDHLGVAHTVYVDHSKLVFDMGKDFLFSITIVLVEEL